MSLGVLEVFSHVEVLLWLDVCVCVCLQSVFHMDDLFQFISSAARRMVWCYLVNSTALFA